MNHQEEIINFLIDIEKELVLEPQRYSNQLTFAFVGSLIPENLKEYFPEMRLHVERVDEETKEHLKSHLDIFFSKLHDTTQSYQTVWLTTSNITKNKLAMVEISFE